MLPDPAVAAPTEDADDSGGLINDRRAANDVDGLKNGHPPWTEVLEDPWRPKRPPRCPLKLFGNLFCDEAWEAELAR